MVLYRCKRTVFEDAAQGHLIWSGDRNLGVVTHSQTFIPPNNQSRGDRGKFTQHEGQLLQRMARRDREQRRAASLVSHELETRVEATDPDIIRTVTPDACVEKLSGIAIAQKIADISDGRRKSTLETDQRSDTLFARETGNLLRLQKIPPKRPLAKHHLAGFDRRCRHLTVKGDVDRHDGKVNFRPREQIVVIVEEKIEAQFPRAPLCRFATCRADRSDFVSAKGLECRKMCHSSATPLGTGADDSHPDFFAHNQVLLRSGATNIGAKYRWPAGVSMLVCRKCLLIRPKLWVSHRVTT